MYNFTVKKTTFVRINMILISSLSLCILKVNKLFDLIFLSDGARMLNIK